MPIELLQSIPKGSNVFVDANILVYGISGQSGQCRQLLERCSREEVTGVCLFEIVNEATHRLMMAEAKSKGLIASERARALREHFELIPTLRDYWRDTERILALNFLFIASTESIVRAAHPERQGASLLTNDSMIVSCMREYGIKFLATRDRDFERVGDITIFRPDDLA